MARLRSTWYREHATALLASIALLTVLLAGCGTGAKQADLARDQTLKMVVPFAGSGQNPYVLDPGQAGDTGSVQVASLVFDGLVTLDRNEHVEPWGASTWTLSADGLTYTFVLRPHQRFSDGTPVKPSDYAWSMDRSANPCLGSPLSYYLAAIKDASAFSAETCSGGRPQGAIKTLVGDSLIADDGADTLMITLARPAGYFLAALTYPTSYAIERRVVTGAKLGADDGWVASLAQGKSGQGGSGMFYVANWTPSAQGTLARLTLKPNLNWWGRREGKTPHLTTIEFIETDANTTMSGTFRSDATVGYSPIEPTDPDMGLLKSQPYFHQQPTLTTADMYFNWKVAPFDDLNARKAFCLALNRDTINQQAFLGMNIPSWHIVPQGMDGYNPHVQGVDGAPTTGNTALARQYWQRYLAAHGGKVPTVKIYVSWMSHPTRAALAMYERQWAQALGVTVQEQLPPDTIITEDSLNLAQMYRFAWAADYPDPQDFLTLLFASDSGFNSQKAHEPDADALMRRADTFSDMSQRIPLYQQAEQMLIDDVATCPLYQATNAYALRPWVKGDFAVDASGLIPNDAWVTGYIAKH